MNTRALTETGAPSSAPFDLNPAPALGFVALALIVATGLATGELELVKYGFPVFALGVAGMLYHTSPRAYLALVWALWMTVPLLRRVVDSYEGWDATNPVVLTPFLVSCVCAADLVHYLRRGFPAHLVGFGFVFGALGLGVVIGGLRTGSASAAFGLLEWSVGPLLALHVARRAARDDGYRATVFRLASVTVVCLGTYAIYQFFVLPSWDRQWIENASITSVGDPTPRGFRAFSALNSPGTFAAIFSILLLLLLTRCSVPLRRVALIVGLQAFALSLVRAAWIAWAVGMAVATLMGRIGRGGVKALGLVAVVAALVLQIGPMAEYTEARINTLTRLSSDSSTQARLRSYSTLSKAAASDPLGRGLGATGVATKLGDSDDEAGAYFDSGLLEFPYVLGWAGTILYAIGLAKLVSAARRRKARSAPDAAPWMAILATSMVLLLSMNVMKGVVGVVFWLCIALWLCDTKPLAPKAVPGAGARGIPA